MLQYTYCWILKAEGWAEVAITASVTDDGLLDDPPPRIVDVNKEQREQTLSH